jgi:hypothetical protein
VSFDIELHNMKKFRFIPNVKLSVHKILKKIYFIYLYYGLDDQGFRVQVPVGKIIFSMSSTPALRPTHPSSYPMGTRVGCFSSGKAVTV